VSVFFYYIKTWLTSINSFCEKVLSRQSFYSVLDTLRLGHSRAFLGRLPFRGNRILPWGRVTHVTFPQSYASTTTTMHSTKGARHGFFVIPFFPVDRGFFYILFPLPTSRSRITLPTPRLDCLQLGCGQCTTRTNHPLPHPTSTNPICIPQTPTYTCSHLHPHTPFYVYELQSPRSGPFLLFFFVRPS
jgi:hypothetical protein